MNSEEIPDLQPGELTIPHTTMPLRNINLSDFMSPQKRLCRSCWRQGKNRTCRHKVSGAISIILATDFVGDCKFYMADAPAGATCGDCVFKPRGAGFCKHPNHGRGADQPKMIFLNITDKICIDFIGAVAEKVPGEVKTDTVEKIEEIPELIKAEAEKILSEGSALSFIITVFNTLHVGDEITGKALLGSIGSQCVLNSSGIQPKLSGSSGKGKSHAAKTIFHLVPKKYIIEASLSDKAIFHAQINPGTLVYSDDVELSEDMQGIIKRATTNFQTTTDHMLSIKRDGDWGVKIVSIPQRVVWCLTSVGDTGTLEFLNRQFSLGVDEKPEQDKSVMKFHLKKAVSGEPEYPVNDEVLTCRAIIDDIKRKLYTVTIPYAENITWSDEENRRNLPQFLDLVKSFAMFDYRNRVRVDDNTIEANQTDFNEAKSLYSKRAINQKFKLNDNELAILQKMDQDTEYYIEDLQKLTDLPYQAVYRAFNGRDGKGGLLQKVTGLTYAPETEFFRETETTERGDERSVMKKTKPKHVYILRNTSLSGIQAISEIATCSRFTK